jgi:Fur family transcriptional regulator, ferric uptake regulator
MTPAEILAHHHLRKTPARLIVVQCLLKSELPLSESEIKEKMQESYDRVTFYRTIQALLKAGIVHRIVPDNTTIRYALNHCTLLHHVHDNDHVHFYCTQCETVECLEEVAVQSYSLPEGYQKKECNVVIKGICKQCTAKNTSK